MTEAFKRLVKLAARAFYDDYVVKGDSRRKAGRNDNRGLAVVVLDALTSRQWVREEDFARSLKLPSKQLRGILWFFEEEKFVNRYHRKETTKIGKMAGVGLQADEEGDGKTKIHNHSYCCLDYAQIYDVVRYRVHRMKKRIQDELEGKNMVQEYICPHCSRRYSAFHALELVSIDDDYFHCERCNAILIAEREKITAEDIGDGDDSSRERRQEKLMDMLRKMEEQLKPLTLQLARVEDLPVPDFGTYQSWEASVKATPGEAVRDIVMVDYTKSAQVLEGGGPPCIGETKVEVRISSSDAVEEVNAAETSVAAKVIPPWLKKQGASLSREEVNGSSALLEDKQEERKESRRSLQEEYFTAYYEAYARMQMELLEASRKREEEIETGEVSAETADRRIGVKSKREELEWKEAPPIGVYHSNVYEEVDDDELEWEEG